MPDLKVFHNKTRHTYKRGNLAHQCWVNNTSNELSFGKSYCRKYSIYRYFKNISVEDFPKIKRQRPSKLPGMPREKVHMAVPGISPYCILGSSSMLTRFSTKSVTSSDEHPSGIPFRNRHRFLTGRGRGFFFVISLTVSEAPETRWVLLATSLATDIRRGDKEDDNM